METPAGESSELVSKKHKASEILAFYFLSLRIMTPEKSLSNKIMREGRTY